MIRSGVGGKKARMLSMTAQIIEGHRMVFLIRNSSYILKAVKMLLMISTQLIERCYADALEQ